MKRVLQIAAVFLLGFGVIALLGWVVGAYVGARLNPMQWTEDSRMAHVFFSILGAVCVSILLPEDQL